MAACMLTIFLPCPDQCQYKVFPMPLLWVMQLNAANFGYLATVEESASLFTIGTKSSLSLLEGRVPWKLID